MYLVTARHVAKDLANQIDPHLRYMPSGGDRLIDKPLEGEWIYHEDPSVDLAVRYLTHYPIAYSGPEEKPTPLKHTAS